MDGGEVVVDPARPCEPPLVSGDEAPVMGARYEQLVACEGAALEDYDGLEFDGLVRRRLFLRASDAARQTATPNSQGGGGATNSSDPVDQYLAQRAKFRFRRVDLAADHKDQEAKDQDQKDLLKALNEQTDATETPEKQANSGRPSAVPDSARTVPRVTPPSPLETEAGDATPTRSTHGRPPELLFKESDDGDGRKRDDDEEHTDAGQPKHSATKRKREADDDEDEGVADVLKIPVAAAAAAKVEDESPSRRRRLSSSSSSSSSSLEDLDAEEHGLEASAFLPLSARVAVDDDARRPQNDQEGPDDEEEEEDSEEEEEEEEEEPQFEEEEEEVEQDEEEAEFNPYVFMKLVPAKTHRPSSSCPRPAVVLPAKTKAARYTLVLDLDETLVHSRMEYTPDADFVFEVDLAGASTSTVYVKARPYLEDFLATVAKSFEVVVFTASHKAYADAVLDRIDPKRKCVDHRLFRDSCSHVDGLYVKDLDTLNRDLSRTAIVDNTPYVFAYQPDNAIPIDSWYDDADDTSLLELLPFLRDLQTQADVRPFLRDTFRLREKIDAAGQTTFAPCASSSRSRRLNHLITSAPRRRVALSPPSSSGETNRRDAAREKKVTKKKLTASPSSRALFFPPTTTTTRTGLDDDEDDDLRVEGGRAVDE